MKLGCFDLWSLAMRVICKSFLVLALGWLSLFAGQEGSLQAADAPAKKYKALMLTQSAGFTHGSVRRPKAEGDAPQKLSASEIAMTQLGQQTGLFDVTCTQDAASDFTKENLSKYDMVIFYTTGNLPIADADKEYFLNDWLKQEGHAFIGFHSATDTFNNYKPYFDFVGGTFDGHPWGAGETVTIKIHDPEFPAMKPLGSELVVKDEIYQYKNYRPENVRVLMSLDMSKCKTKRPYMVPVSWVKEHGKGRLFYTNLGHNEGTWTNPTFLEHAHQGIRWALRLEEGNATPNPELQAKLQEEAKAAAEPAK